MVRHFIARIHEVAVALVAATAWVTLLSSCGVKGPLKPPAPTVNVSVPAPEAPRAPSTEPAASPPKPPEPRP